MIGYKVILPQNQGENESFSRAYDSDPEHFCSATHKIIFATSSITRLELSSRPSPLAELYRHPNHVDQFISRFNQISFVQLDHGSRSSPWTCVAEGLEFHSSLPVSHASNKFRSSTAKTLLVKILLGVADMLRLLRKIQLRKLRYHAVLQHRLLKKQKRCSEALWAGTLT